MFSNTIKLKYNMYILVQHVNFHRLDLCVVCVCVYHMVQYPIHKAASKVSKTDIINKMNAICFSVSANRDCVAPTVVGSSSSSLSSSRTAATVLDCNVLCLMSVNELNR